MRKRDRQKVLSFFAGHEYWVFPLEITTLVDDEDIKVILRKGMGQEEVRSLMGQVLIEHVLSLVNDDVEFSRRLFRKIRKA